ncbi:MAG: ACT domain-containing protein [Pseudomonadota bacterium]
METVRDTDAMIKQMSPRLEPGCYIFKQARNEADLVQSLPLAVAMFREAEGISMIVPSASDAPMAMRQITLQVPSALDGVGLTAAVSDALATAGIPCNIVAAFAHDHVFVPVAQAEAALDALKDRAKAAA